MVVTGGYLKPLRKMCKNIVRYSLLEIVVLLSIMNIICVVLMITIITGLKYHCHPRSYDQSTLAHQDNCIVFYERRYVRYGMAFEN